MELAQAIAMLNNDGFTRSQPEEWADLGSGSGTFTIALASLLKAGSIVHAIDTNRPALQKIPSDHNGVTIKEMIADFENTDLPLRELNGILMANSLHYVKNKTVFINKAAGYLAPDGKFLIVEYDTDTSNQWVPYPLSFFSLQDLVTKEGFGTVKKLHEQPSIYRRANIYSAIAYIQRR